MVFEPVPAIVPPVVFGFAGPPLWATTARLAPNQIQSERVVASGIHCRAVSELRQCTRAQPGIKQTSAGNRLKTLELQEEVNQGKKNSGSLGFQGKCHTGRASSSPRFRRDSE
jgi:hypothetical protein